MREPDASERLPGEVPVTQFGRRGERLGMGIVAASSPQAKGRGERNHGTPQDRLVRKRRRKGMGGLEGANRYLGEEYCEGHNARYAVATAAAPDYHLPTPGAKDLEKILRLEAERVLSHDWVAQHENRFYQGERQSQHHAPGKSKVRVCAWEDRRLGIHYRGGKLR